MAPITRSMADDNLVPTPDMASYYGRRAEAGLIISEAILVAKDGQGYPNGPGIYTPAQVEGWRKVTEQVHAKGGKIFAQIWHTGRVSHSIYHDGALPMAPSAIAVIADHVPHTELQYETPRPMTLTDIHRVISDFKLSALNAIEAGFDGIEIHGANGYLIDQFLHWSSNQREDLYGGSPENMSRFLLEILDAVASVVPLEQVGVRLSPHAYVVMEPDRRDKQVFDYLLAQLERYPLAYLHTGIFNDEKIDYLHGSASEYIRQRFSGPVIANGGYSPSSAATAISNSTSDLVAFGRHFVANPDFVHRVKHQQQLMEYSSDMLDTLV